MVVPALDPVEDRRRQVAPAGPVVLEQLELQSHGPDSTSWDDVDEVELATLPWVHWVNEHRLHGHCDDVPPAEFEAAFYAAQQADPQGVATQ